LKNECFSFIFKVFILISISLFLSVKHHPPFSL